MANLVKISKGYMHYETNISILDNDTSEVYRLGFKIVVSTKQADYYDFKVGMEAKNMIDWLITDDIIYFIYKD